ncbi:hypothetical protein DH2020_038783 [Rehmannia glutinosa]|uniref:Uncharacterized protein n=1 Tax=Rehmannia glutinosa TaxID=99300 RepID=A0ABR0V084_REHGL
MSVSCGVECVVILGCMRWAWKRCTYIGSDDSATWPIATADEFEPIPRVCRIILAVYEPDLRCPKYAPAGGFRLNPDWVIKRVAYEQTDGRAPPYLIYLDHDNREIVLAIRGLNLVKESDYKLLLDNRLGMQMFDGGYVHHGLLKSAIWVLNAESETLRRLWEENGREYKMVFAGHSLGSGVAALLSVIVANHGNKLGGIPRSLVKCYAVAPARCMSLNLAVKYADIICSVVLQSLKELSTETTMTPPKVQKLDRKLTLEKEHKDALERAVSLNIPHAVTPSEESSSAYTEEGSSVDKSVETEHSVEKENSFCKNARTNWNEVVEKLFKKNESGQLLLKRDVSVPLQKNALDSFCHIISSACFGRLRIFFLSLC